MVMDFGFGAFLDKFESHFGKAWSKAMVALIGATVVLFCMGLIYKGVVYPLYKVLILDQSIPFSLALETFTNVILMIAILSMRPATKRFSRANQVAETLRDGAYAITLTAKWENEELAAEQMKREARRVIKRMLRESIDHAVLYEGVTQERAESLQLLLGIAPETQP